MRSPPATVRVPTKARRTAAGAVRIVGGRWKRTVLQVVDAPGLRPTPDRVRETLYNWLTHAFGGGLDGRVVLDLYAGSGALGIEAASRGASSVTLVERDAPAVNALRTAKAALDATQIDIVHGDAMEIGAAFAAHDRRFDLILLDPPFGHRQLDAALPLAASLCAASGFVYVEAETALQAAQFEPLDLELYRADKAGEVFYHLLRRNIKER